MAARTRITAKENGPHPLDVALGARIRLRRKELGLSQEDLGKLCGDITFQQVQKYEHGANRVSFSRLVQIAATLQCSVSSLISDLDNDQSGKPVAMDALKALNEPGALNLLVAFSVISTGQRKAVLDLACQLAGKD
jgi:transcriptional regulator with XRE-family HTH domain